MIPKKLLLNPEWKEIFEEYNLKKKIEKLDRNFRFSINWITIASFRLKKRLRILVGILLESLPKYTESFIKKIQYLYRNLTNII